MKPLPIVWKRLVSPEGKTCDRCGATYLEMLRAIEKLTQSLRPLGIEPTLEIREIDEKTFKAIQALRAGILSDEADALGKGVEDNAAEIWKLMQESGTHVYLAGMKKISDSLDQAMGKVAGSADQWNMVKQRMIEERRWTELTYH